MTTSNASILLFSILFVCYEWNNSSITSVAGNIAIARKLNPEKSTGISTICFAVTFFRINIFMVLVWRFYFEYKAMIEKVFHDR